MATRRSRIVVKPNFKPKAAAPAPKPKASPAAALTEAANVATGGKLVASSEQKDALASVTEKTTKTDESQPETGNKNNNIINNNNNDKDKNSGTSAEDSVRQKLSSFLRKPNVPDLTKESGGREQEADDNSSLEATRLNTDCSGKETPTDERRRERRKEDDENASKERETTPVPSLTPDKDKLSTTDNSVEVGGSISPSNDGAASSTNDVDAAHDLDLSKRKEGCAPTTTTTDGSNEKTTGETSGEASTSAGIVEITEESAKQSKPKRKRQEKKERKEPLPPSDKSPDRHTMKMGDLIVWNPTRNYFPKKKKTANPVKKEDRPVSLDSTVSNPVSVDDDESSNQSSSLPAPQVMIGPDGNIILNTQSLIIETAKEDKEVKVIIEDDDERYLNSNSYRKTTKAKMWSETENEKFFMGLRMCGTDFSLMCNLLPKRSRRELKDIVLTEAGTGKYGEDEDENIKTNRQVYDVAPFERMAAAETAKLKEEATVKQELKRKYKQEMADQKLQRKRIKKEKGARSTPGTKKKGQDWEEDEEEEEEDNWDEPEYADEGDENALEEEDMDGNDEMAASTASSTTTTQRPRNARKTKKTTPAPSGACRPTARDLLRPNGADEPFVPRALTANAAANYNNNVEEATMVTDFDFGGVVSHQRRTTDGAGISTITLPPFASSSSTNLGGPIVIGGSPSQPGVPRRTVVGASATATTTTASAIATNRLAAGLRSIPGTAPIQIEMEGFTRPMQGVLVPSHMVPQLAPQLGIPHSTTPIQVLLVQEEGGSGGNLVHVYIIPDKESTPFAQTGHGRMVNHESGGLTLTSPVPSPLPVSRRPSTSSINPASPCPSPFSPTAGAPPSPSPLMQNAPHPGRSPQAGSSHHFTSPTHQMASPAHHFTSPTHQMASPAHHFTSPTHQMASPAHHFTSPTHQMTSPAHQSETSMTTIRNVYGTAMNSLTNAARPRRDSTGATSQPMPHYRHPPPPLHPPPSNGNIGISQPSSVAAGASQYPSTTVSNNDSYSNNHHQQHQHQHHHPQQLVNDNNNTDGSHPNMSPFTPPPTSISNDDHPPPPPPTTTTNTGSHHPHPHPPPTGPLTVIRNPSAAAVVANDNTKDNNTITMTNLNPPPATVASSSDNSSNITGSQLLSSPTTHPVTVLQNAPSNTSSSSSSLSSLHQMEQEQQDQTPSPSSSSATISTTAKFPPAPSTSTFATTTNTSDPAVVTTITTTTTPAPTTTTTTTTTNDTPPHTAQPSQQYHSAAAATAASTPRPVDGAASHGGDGAAMDAANSAMTTTTTPSLQQPGGGVVVDSGEVTMNDSGAAEEEEEEMDCVIVNPDNPCSRVQQIN